MRQARPGAGATTRTANWAMAPSCRPTLRYGSPVAVCSTRSQPGMTAPARSRMTLMPFTVGARTPMGSSVAERPRHRMFLCRLLSPVRDLRTSSPSASAHQPPAPSSARRPTAGATTTSANSATGQRQTNSLPVRSPTSSTARSTMERATTSCKACSRWDRPCMQRLLPDCTSPPMAATRSHNATTTHSPPTTSTPTTAAPPSTSQATVA